MNNYNFTNTPERFIQEWEAKEEYKLLIFHINLTGLRRFIANKLDVNSTYGKPGTRLRT